MKTNQPIPKNASWYRHHLIQEIIFFVAIFMLTMVQQWIQIDTFIGFIKGLVFFLILYVQAQLHRFFVFPLLTAKKYGTYIIISVLSLLLGANILYLANSYWIAPQFYQSSRLLPDILYFFVITVASTITIMGLFLTQQYHTELQKRSQDQILLNEMNIKLLHAQLNPHFFFNMFNNLYGVSLAHPERTPELVLKLSRLMRYQLGNGNKLAVDISDEINFISNYIDIEKERIGKRCHITFVRPGENEMNKFVIAPLMLITLVENAFKHSLTISRKWFVSIYIGLNEDMLNLRISNSLPDESLKSESTGIGIQNIRQRLELLYPGRYRFESYVNEHEYLTELTLRLNQSVK